MKSADDLILELKRIVGMRPEDSEITLSFDYDTIPEAKLEKKKAIHIQKELRLLKKETNATIKFVRSNYTVKKSNVQAGFFASLRGKRAGGKERAKKKEALRQEQERVIAPYKNLVENTDQILLDIDKLKLEIDKWIVENQSK
jgi:hypothetical protein